MKAADPCGHHQSIGARTKAFAVATRHTHWGGPGSPHNPHLPWRCGENPLNCPGLHRLIIHIRLLRSCLWHCRSKAGGVLLLVLFFASAGPACGEGGTIADKSIASDISDPYVGPTNGLGSWIWEEKVADNQTCRLWKTFVIPAAGKVVKARLVMTADNEFTLYLDGRELGHGAEWRELFVFDLTRLLTPGRHVLAVECFNGSFYAGMLLGLRVDLADGRTIEVKSDRSWSVVPKGVSRWKTTTEVQANWTAARIKAPLGGTPWWTRPENVNLMPTLQPINVCFWQTGWFQITLLSVCGLVILFSLRLMAQLALHRKERWLLQQERARIAREIHDDIGSRMTQLVLHGEVAQSGLPEDSEMQRQIVQLCEEARRLLATMDEILWAVNPRRDTLRDFTAYVCKYAEDFLRSTQIQCYFEVDSEISTAAFNLPLRRSLLMAIKETLNNAVKHSGATELHLQIHWQGQRLVVVVQDNGRGFDPAVIKSERNGLANMTQRMSELGGHCLVASQPGKGCRVEFNIPLKRPQPRLWTWVWNPRPFSEHLNETGAGRSNESRQHHDPTKC
jgi:signal transduction histidine kinase